MVYEILTDQRRVRFAGRTIAKRRPRSPREFRDLNLHIGGKRYAMLFAGAKGWATDMWSAYGIERDLASASNNRIEVGGEVFEFSSLGYADALAEAGRRCAG